MLAPIVLFADCAGTLDVGDATEVRARTTQQSTSGAGGGATTGAGLDVYTQPTLTAHLTDRIWAYDITYRPSFTFQDLQSSSQLLAIHTGNATVAWRERRVRLSLGEDASYGSYNSANILPPSGPSASAGTPTPTGAAMPPQVQLSPSPRTITYLATTTTMTVVAQTDRRSTFMLSTAYTARGGADEPSRAVLPELHGPRVDARFAYALSRSDQAVTAAYGQVVEFSAEACVGPTGMITAGSSCAPENRLAQATEGIRHAINSATSVTLSAGAAVAQSRSDPASPFRAVLYPAGVADIIHRFGGERGTSSVNATASIGPVVDALTGLASDRLQGQASVTDQVSHAFTATFTASGTQTLPTSAPLAATLLGGTIAFALRLDPSLEFALGERAVWQRQDTFGTFFSTYTYFDVTVRAPELRF